MTSFRKWFKAQYKGLPSASRVQRLEKEVDDANERVSAAIHALWYEKRLWEKWQDALDGWNAHDYATKGKRK